MSENQKLREAFETYITDGGKWPNAILKAPGGQYLLLRTSVAWQDWKACAEALALPTADHIPDAGEMVADHLPDAGKMIETAAPVGEREAFEEWAREQFYSGPACPSDTWSDDRKTYSDAAHHMAFCAFRAALSTGAVVDAQRYRWLREQSDDDFAFAVVKTPHFDVYESPEELDAAIDAAMRKGQL